MSDGAPMAELPPRPKQATSLVFATVVVIVGAEEPTCPLEPLMGAVVSALKYVLIPPATLEEEEMVKAYGPGSAAGVPATFQNVAVVRVLPLLVLTIDVQPNGAVIVGGGLEPARAVTDASMMSFAAVAPGRVRLSDVTELPLLLVAPRNPMPVPAAVSAV